MAQEFIVRDMTCCGCVSSVRKTVSQVPGVQAVAINLSQNQVRVDASENVTADQIVQAINAAGYTEVTPRSTAPVSNETGSDRLSSGAGSGCCA